MLAFRYSAFRLYWVGQVTTNVGTWMQFVATGWLVLELTDSPADLGITAALQGLPTAVVMLFGGLIADRFNRYRLVLIVGAMRLVPDVTLAVLVGSGHVQVWHIFAYALANGVMDGLNSPAGQALLPSTVPRSALMSALSLNAIVYQGSAVLGPTIAGLVLATWGTAANFYINVLSDVLSLILLLMMRVESPKMEAARLAFGSVIEGLRYAWRRSELRFLLLTVASVSVLARPYSALLSVMARNVFQAGPQAFGLMVTMPAIGTVVAGVIMATMRNIPLARAFLTMAATVCLVLVAFSNSPLFPLSLGLLVLVGASVTTSQTLANTLLQRSIHERMRGRLMGLFGVCTIAAWKIGSLPFGYIAQVWGAPRAITVGAVVLLVVVLVVIRSRVLLVLPAEPRDAEVTAS